MEALTRRPAVLGLGTLIGLNAFLLWYGLSADAVTVGLTVEPEILGFAVRLSDERTTYSILDAIWKLRADGNTALFVLVLVFSLVFPTLKLAGTAWIWSQLAGAQPSDATTIKVWSHRLSHLGKWSMLEVFMVAFLCSLLKAGDMVRLIIEPGIYWFSAAVVVSIINAIWVSRLAECPSGPSGLEDIP